MKDKIIRGTAKDGMVRFVGGITTNLVNEGVSLHECTPVASAALGRMLTACSLMGVQLKSDKEVITLKINGGGELNGVTVTGHSDGSVKGFVGNPNVDLPLKENGKLDVSGAVGTNGLLYVIKDMGMKDPYVGQVPIYTGEIAEDLAYYFTVSEQTPSAVLLGVLVDKDLSIKAAGGVIIQMMPDADEMLADLITYRIQDLKSITTLIEEGKTIEDIIGEIFEDMDPKILDTIEPEYRCDCSKERVNKALISLGEKELQEIYDDNKSEEIVCHFCNKKYEMTHDEIGELLKECRK